MGGTNRWKSQPDAADAVSKPSVWQVRHAGVAQYTPETTQSTDET